MSHSVLVKTKANLFSLCLSSRLFHQKFLHCSCVAYKCQRINGVLKGKIGVGSYLFFGLEKKYYSHALHRTRIHQQKVKENGNGTKI